ncbi:MAG: PilC/PilY family type IV pilus protein [Gammaproteobacteria bacterium]|nr:PilC/PilY family type IV pilus protein [Gammaproteobacteria bacterium]
MCPPPATCRVSPTAAAAPPAVDTDLNGTVDRVYAGDRLGNMFRFDLSDADPDDWTATRLFTASYDDGGNANPPADSQSAAGGEAVPRSRASW